ncbi:hypothetical protein KDK95_15740 [Actinospica sp. MGRD01-02]|uniref:Uncharacterized protein n=1 Tax=Actinospica acidithermotolerans TaxID=2828514 RepID=A0A941ILM8_9ACTN|nr:hypothetical protein [Actinospica acidithermotolerans]MBR7827771.1 hypothetical protein [Actinospica acidithermotolerans]
MTIPSVPVTAAEFPLVLLRRMADYQPQLVEDARTRLGYDVSEMRAVNATWQRMLRSRHSRGPLGQLHSVLGRPVEVVERTVGDAPCRCEQWELPQEVWPGLRFEAFIGPGDMLLKEHLVRAPGAARPVLRGLGDLTPWSCVLGDVAVAFGRLRQLEGSAPTRDLALIDDIDDGSGQKITVAAEFVYGLLQSAYRY